MTFPSPSLRGRVQRGDTVVGTWMFTPNPAFAEIASLAALDFVLIDLEHGAIALADLPHLLRALHGGPTSAVVRVPSHDMTLISRVLDRGAHGILVPRVDDARTAAQVASAARFPPIGNRGLALGAIRASGYGLDTIYRASAQQDVLVAVQIESAEALEHALEIGRAPGVDVAFIGPNDLAGALQLEGAGQQAAFVKIVDETFAKLHAAGIPTGTIPHAGRDWRALAQAGVQLHIAGGDTVFMREGLLALKRSATEAAPAPAGAS